MNYVSISFASYINSTPKIQAYVRKRYIGREFKRCSWVVKNTRRIRKLFKTERPSEFMLKPAITRWRVVK
jgi:hypothetical protein